MRSDYIFVTLLALSLLLWPAKGSLSYSTDYTTLLSYCTGSPYWRLNRCNISCSTCLANDQTKCLTCDDNFTLSSTYCKLKNDTNTYILQEYFTSTTVADSDLNLWSNSA